MLAQGKTDVAQIALRKTEDISIGELLRFLSDHPMLPLSFAYGGRAIRNGYHVTEVKAGKFAALDCGANPESWTEIFVQLWDVDDAPAQMTARKFGAIIRKVTQHVALDMSARLTFEVSDGVAPMQLYGAGEPKIVGDEIVVELSARPASCKPRDRWLQEQAVGCRGTASTGAAQPCCS